MKEINEQISMKKRQIEKLEKELKEFEE